MGFTPPLKPLQCLVMNAHIEDMRIILTSCLKNYMIARTISASYSEYTHKIRARTICALAINLRQGHKLTVVAF